MRKSTGQQLVWALACAGALAAASAAHAADPADAAAAPARPRLFVRDLGAQGVSPEEAAALTDAVVNTLAGRGLFQVIAQKDVKTLLTTERERQLLGHCGEVSEGEDPGCAADLSQALEAPFVLTGALSRVGNAYQLTLETLDVQKGRSLARSARLAGDLTTLTRLVPYAAAEATGSPLPPPRPRWAQYSMIAGGGGLVLGGAFYGLLAVSREQALGEQLCPGGPEAGVCRGENLGFLADAQRQGRVLARDKTVSLGIVAGGVGLVTAGLLLLPPPEAGPRVALVPTGNGVAFAGVFW